jgi:hypothetical protein
VHHFDVALQYAQHRAAQEHPCQQLAQHGRLTDLLRQLSQQLGRDQYRHQQIQELGHAQRGTLRSDRRDRQQHSDPSPAP